jgi:branched-chain amino acid transport system ATP-binding protein
VSGRASRVRSRSRASCRAIRRSRTSRSRFRPVRDRASASCARAGIPAGLLSHGEKRQLELAIALATEPKLLLLDEPLAGTSHEESRRIIEILQSLKGHVAILLIEHDMDAVFALADRISVLVYGEIVATGSPAEIRANPEVRAAYLGEEAA